jgi:hypothetical protein
MSWESLEFHIQENDYFGTLATVLDLLGQDLRRHGHTRHAETLVRLRDDLLYLQCSYTINGTAGEEQSGAHVVTLGRSVWPNEKSPRRLLS